MTKRTSQEAQQLISVIVPVYNVEKYIHRCVDSILNQTYRNLEIILVDDGSPDNCGKICDKYAEADPRVKVIHQKNAGLSEARNAGINIAAGEYIAFVDSDDYIEQNMYETMYSELILNKADICVCQWQYEFSDGKQVVDINNIDSEIYGKMKAEKFAEFFYRGSYENGVVCAAWNKLYKADVFSEIRFVGRLFEDDRIHNQILSKDYVVVVIPEQLYLYCENSDSLTNKSFRENRLLIFDILSERLSSFSNNEFILVNTRKLYCNIYIEYYYKAKKSNVKMPGYKEFDRIFREILLKSKVDVSFIIRMILFRISPKIYAKVCHIE